jgi:hypothetical protein
VPICVGDCNRNRTVDTADLVRSVYVALDLLPLSSCPDLDPSETGNVKITTLVQAVQNSITGCP